jgi:phosphoserine aminotransferase
MKYYVQARDNFSTGPSMLPLSALARAAAEITYYDVTEMPVME